MGIQINGQTDSISAIDGSLAIQGASGDVTGNITGNVNSTGVSTFSGGIVVAAGSTSAPSISPSGDSNTGIFFPSPDTVAIGEGGVEALRVDSSGNVQITNGNLVFSTAGTGIDFSANSNAAGMTSELLDDYEEGTWTPVYRQGSSSGTEFTVSGGTQYARYIKVGRIVLVNFGFTFSTVSGSAGAMYITGFPFTLWSTGSAGLRSIGTSIFYINGFNTSGNLSLFAEDTYAIAVAQGATNWSVPTYTPASNSYFHCSFTYESNS